LNEFQPRSRRTLMVVRCIKLLYPAVAPFLNPKT
jgi:hypothetical protein